MIDPMLRQARGATFGREWVVMQYGERCDGGFAWRLLMMQGF
jgi:hypothetical protein